MGNNGHKQCYNVTADINEGGIVCHALNGQINVVCKQNSEASMEINVGPNSQ